MFQGIKNFLRRIFPASIASVSYRTDQLLNQQKASEKRLLSAMRQNEKELRSTLSASSKATDIRIAKALASSSKGTDTRIGKALAASSKATDIRIAKALASSSKGTDTRVGKALASAAKANDDRMTKALTDSAKATNDRMTKALADSAKATNDRMTKAIAASASASDDKTAKAIAASINAMAGKITKSTESTARSLEKTNASIERSIARLERVMERVTRLEERHIEMTERVNARAKAQLERSNILLGFEKESVWAHVFNNAITGSDWATSIPLWPGRFSVGYAYLFVLFRALTALRPQRILDIGLGITTRFFGGYTTEEPGAQYTVVEDNEEWISFFSNNEPFPENAEVLHLPVSYEPYGEGEEGVTMYQGFAEALQGKQFDLISIDAPFSGKETGDDREHSRVDILSILPGCLASSFVILVDDYHRIGEQNTVAAMEALLAENGIEAIGKAYEGTKKFYVLVSPDNGFLLTL